MTVGKGLELTNVGAQDILGLVSVAYCARLRVSAGGGGLVGVPCAGAVPAAKSLLFRAQI